MPDLDACIIKNCIHFGLQNGDKFELFMYKSGHVDN